MYRKCLVDIERIRIASQNQKIGLAAVKMTEKIKSYYDKALSKRWYIYSTILNPNFKLWVFTEKLDFDDQSLRDIRSDFELSARTYEKVSGSSSKEVTNRIESDFLGDFKKKRRTSGFDQEFSLYLNSEDAVDGDEEVLEFWKLNQKKYPTLANMAKDILATPSTSVNVERLFSVGKLINTDMRGALHGSTLGMLMCLNSWWKMGYLNE